MLGGRSSIIMPFSYASAAIMRHASMLPMCGTPVTGSFHSPSLTLIMWRLRADSYTDQRTPEMRQLNLPYLSAPSKNASAAYAIPVSGTRSSGSLLPPIASLGFVAFGSYDPLFSAFGLFFSIHPLELFNTCNDFNAR